MKKSEKSKTIRAIMVVVFGLVLVSVAFAATQYFNPNDYYTADVIRIDGTATVVTGTGCRGLVADTTEERANSIRLGLEGKIEERPNSHDIYVQTLKNFNITIESATIDSYDDSFYYSNLILKKEDKVVKMDSKPSDAIAIALRAAAPIYIKKELLDKEGKSIC